MNASAKQDSPSDLQDPRRAIRKLNLANDTISTVAGNGTAGRNGDGGPAVNAQLGEPTNATIDPAGNLDISDTGNGVIRRIAAGF